jgi:hypothetical protein
MQGGQYSRTYGAPATDVRAEFFMEAVRDGRASLDAGRDIFSERERVKIIIPGMIASVLVAEVNDDHRQRWPQQYAAFKAGQEAPVTGTPLEEWPILNRAAIAELKHLQIHTVEELAALSDIAVQHIGMGGQILRERARGWLDDAQHEALTTKLAHENDLLRTEIGSLRGQVEELSRQLTALSVRMLEREDRLGGIGTLVPGEVDPVEIAKARMPPIPGETAVRSALDRVASRPTRAPRNRHRQDPDPEALGAAEGGEQAA